MRKSILSVFCSVIHMASWAQSPPTPVKELAARGDAIVRKSEVSNEQRKYLWQNTKADPEGYLVIESSIDAINLIEQASKFIKHGDAPKNYLPAAEKFVLQGYPSLGFIPEGDKRYTFLFGSTATRIMYTVWDYRDDGASITQVEEFFNVKIHEEPGVIAVLANQNTENILWKLTWLKNGVSHEIYVEDKKSRRGTPSRSPAEIVRLAEEL